METIYTKLDIKDAYYSVPVFEDHQSLLKFQYIHSLFKFNALPYGYTGQGNLRSFRNFWHS